MERYCPKCKKEISMLDVVCPHCGAKIEWEHSKEKEQVPTTQEISSQQVTAEAASNVANYKNTTSSIGENTTSHLTSNFILTIQYFFTILVIHTILFWWFDAPNDSEYWICGIEAVFGFCILVTGGDDSEILGKKDTWLACLLAISFWVCMILFGATVYQDENSHILRTIWAFFSIRHEFIFTYPLSIVTEGIINILGIIVAFFKR
uniref:zinc ribbon domain-containing protein n=1 Tax=Dialister sp. TaxID=1955814 RepID=UPI00402791B0